MSHPLQNWGVDFMPRGKNAKNTPVTRAFLTHETAIRAFLRRFLSNSQETEDLTQEVFIRAYQSEKTQKIQQPKAFLYGIARNLARKEISRKSRAIIEYIEDFAPSEDLSNETAVEDIADSRQKLRLLSEAVAQLPPQCRKVFVLRKVYGFSVKEIARQLKISASTVEKHIAAGVRKTADHVVRMTHLTDGAQEEHSVAVFERRQRN